MPRTPRACALVMSLVFLSSFIAACAPNLTVGSQGEPSSSSSSSGGMGGAGGSGSGGGTGGTGGPSLTSSASSSAVASSSGGSNLMLGDPCTMGGQCGSGFCYSGVCCAQNCGMECATCNFPGYAGACKPLPVGTSACSVPGELCDGMAQCACGVSKPGIGGNCPAPWINGPTPKTCTIHCDGLGACNTDISCPPGFNCNVECSGTDSCNGIDFDIECPEGQACNVSCTGLDSCRTGFRVRCSDTGPCTLQCGSASGACLGADLRCGDNACKATCAGMYQPSVDHGNSCGVTEC